MSHSDCESLLESNSDCLGQRTEVFFFIIPNNWNENLKNSDEGKGACELSVLTVLDCIT